ncbi:MAG TPA: hypothetical protein VI653_27920 [Steroidobacteraceae bacterium]
MLELLLLNRYRPAQAIFGISILETSRVRDWLGWLECGPKGMLH